MNSERERVMAIWGTVSAELGRLKDEKAELREQAKDMRDRLKAGQVDDVLTWLNRIVRETEHG